MKNSVLKLLLIIACCTLTACDDIEDYDETDKKITIVTYKVTCNKPDTPLRISATDTDGAVVYNGWKQAVRTKAYYAQMSVSYKGDDPNVRITAEIYVMGKLKTKKSDHNYIVIGMPLKGSPI